MLKLETKVAQKNVFRLQKLTVNKRCFGKMIAPDMEIVYHVRILSFFLFFAFLSKNEYLKQNKKKSEIREQILQRAQKRFYEDQRVKGLKMCSFLFIFIVFND